MKKILLIFSLILLPILYSFKNEKNIVGTMYLIQEGNTFYIEYNGKYHQCFMRYFVINLFPECDSTNYNTQLDSLFKIEKNIHKKQKNSKDL